MPTKGYPRTRFEIVDRTDVQEISTNNITYPKPLAMQLITADKGPENWTVIRDLDDFTNRYGAISFAKHGQAQLNVAEILRAGGAVLVKRLVRDECGIGNVTYYITLTKTLTVETDKDTVATYKINSKSVEMKKDDNNNIPTFKTHQSVVDAVENGAVLSNIMTVYNFKDTEIFETDDTTLKSGVTLAKTYSETKHDYSMSVDIPIFTISTVDRACTPMVCSLVPVYNNDYMIYRFSLYDVVNEKNKLISGVNNLNVSLNGDIMINNIPYDLESRINSNMPYIRAKLYSDYINEYVNVINKIISNTIITIDNIDIINFYNLKGVEIEIDDYFEMDNAKRSKNGMVIGINCSDTYDLAFNDDNYVTLALAALGKEKAIIGTTNTYSYLNCKNKDNDFDTIIYDVDRYKIDFACDAGYDIRIKKAITYLADSRQDFVFLSDLKNIRITDSVDSEFYDINSKSDIINAAKAMPESKFIAIYFNTADIYDPYTKKQINITLPCLLGPKMVNHINNGVGKPFAGILNGITFPEIIDGSVNFIPRVYHNIDQKAEFIERNINYISYYDSLPTMDTMYVNMPNYTQLSYLNNIMNVQTIIKELRTRCPKTRYSFMDGTDLQKYLDDTISIINNYNSFFKSISIKYMADAEYESQNIFYAVLTVQFRNFVQEEYFRIFAIS